MDNFTVLPTVIMDGLHSHFTVMMSISTVMSTVMMIHVDRDSYGKMIHFTSNS